ncbi:hypothetical protein A8139_00325 [Marinomonas primoryensis]|uniref:FMN hydroxy acid dehydrogenase domain-containing protein n=2 Tax=Marinomonas primoryensis TaxID=178399 RepID=A0A2Z4PME5_9GAMM|nr:hypothetical protein A8139_00325 [Marinomonas primoryensis]
MDWEYEAQNKLPRDVYDFIAGGSGDEVTLSCNRDALSKLKIVNRVLQNIDDVEIHSKKLDLFCKNKDFSSPLIIAPTAHHQMVHPSGELATSKAALSCKIPYIQSTMSDISIAALRQAGCPPDMLQLYIFKDRSITQELICAAKEAGVTSIVLTVDVPEMGIRYRDRKNNFSVDRFLFGTNRYKDSTQMSSSSTSHEADFANKTIESKLSWKDIDWLRNQSKLPIILKGVLHKEDALQAKNNGIDGLYLSNHGGRQLDGSISAALVIEEIRKVIGYDFPLIVDGGFSSGSDIVKAIALGADGVAIGRPLLWALAVNGQQGVVTLLNQYLTELMLTMKLCGCKNLEEIRAKNILKWT